eukprot:TRINITY_DN37069_c0_g1_i1.p1 TRINITY_DN37069_c0_g1~~TRINITY_DN37069_c0_g1_i1.p1  ORF type:complete len:471 (+),score=188.71 TRINITY_DN37069_c0_g1_i1:76-1488(+)
MDSVSRLFHQVDLDKDGCISYSELRALFLQVSPTHARVYAPDVFQEADRDGSRMIEFGEFKEIVLPLLRSLGIDGEAALELVVSGGGVVTEAEICAAQPLFDACDSDLSGSITKMELEEMMDVLKPGSTSQEILALMMAADQDGGGDVDVEEFARFMRRVELPFSLQEAADKLKAHFHSKREAMNRRKSMFAQQDAAKPALEASRRRRVRVDDAPPAEPVQAAGTPPAQPAVDADAAGRIAELEEELRWHREELRKQRERLRRSEERRKLDSAASKQPQPAPEREDPYLGLLRPGHRLVVVTDADALMRSAPAQSHVSLAAAPATREPVGELRAVSPTRPPPLPRTVRHAWCAVDAASPPRRWEDEQGWPWARLDDSWRALVAHWDRSGPPAGVPVAHCSIAPGSGAVGTERRSSLNRRASTSPPPQPLPAHRVLPPKESRRSSRERSEKRPWRPPPHRTPPPSRVLLSR